MSSYRPPFLCLALSFLTIATAHSAPTLDGETEEIRARHGLPALAVLAMKDGKVLGEAAAGVRKLGGNERVTVSDSWHIGSCTKAMTATLAAMFVQEGRLKWTTSVGEVFPEWKAQTNPDWAGVTLEQLLTHRSGAPGDAPRDLWAVARKRQGTPREQRLAFVKGLVTRAPEAPPGTKYIYSNQGFAIAGAMLERVSNRSWEDLMRERLFLPLHMESAGFGEPATVGKIDQPWGHASKGDILEAVPPGPNADNPPAIGPAGTVHCTLRDWARFALIHAEGERLGWGKLPPDAFVKLHTPATGQEYAMGWIVTPRGWAGGPALTHMGSNTTFLTDIWIAPKKDAIFISATNSANDEASKACDEAIAAMIQRYLN